MSIKKFDYEGKPISFKFSDGNKMINATEMAKPFGKPVGNFLRLNETKSYIQLLESRYSDVNVGETNEVLRILKGGNRKDIQGTWMDEKLALKFAAWLSPAFELWVYDRIQELLITGKTELTTNQPTSNIISAIRLIADKLEYQERDINELKEGLQEIKEFVGELEAKIISVDSNYFTIAGYCSLIKKPCPLHFAKEWGKQATALSRQRQVPTGTAHDERYGKVRTYNKNILKDVI